MAHLTGNFTSEAPLSPRVREAISVALSDGWADPKKLSQASHRAKSLQVAALDELGEILRVAPSKIEVLGEPALLHHIAIGGFLSPGSELITSAIDVGKIRAISRNHQGATKTLAVDSQGLIEGGEISANSIFSLQATNGETGIKQDLDRWRNLDRRIILDATRAIPTADITQGFTAATFDAKSWMGPAGIGFIAINDEQNFNYPLPHIAPIRVPGSFSLPLLVGAVVALNEYRENVERIQSLRISLAQQLTNIPRLTLVGFRQRDSSPYLSAVIDGISSEELLRATATMGIFFDAGSACSPENLKPSHVIAAMGFETTGHIRFTIHEGLSEIEITGLAKVLGEALNKLTG